jgi:hypothetical protein
MIHSSLTGIPGNSSRLATTPINQNGMESAMTNKKSVIGDRHRITLTHSIQLRATATGIGVIKVLARAVTEFGRACGVTAGRISLYGGSMRKIG